MQGTKADETIPLFNLNTKIHFLLIMIIFPLVVSLISVVVFSLFFSYLFLKFKNVVSPKYENAYINIEDSKFNLKKFMIRAIYFYLLCLGASSTFLSVFDLSQIISPERVVEYAAVGIPLEYTYNAFLGSIFLIFPILIGLWAIGWALEDAGLMHYRLPQGNEKLLYKIEPVFSKFNPIVKGFAGIGAIYYLIKVSIYLLINPSYHIDEIMLVVFSVLPIIGAMIPAYLVYIIFSHKIINKVLRRNLKELRILNKNDLST